MKNSTRLLNSILILVLSCFFQFANAQIIYTDVIPDYVNGCSTFCAMGPSCIETFDIDLNQDGQADFTLTSESFPHFAFSQPCWAGVGVSALNGNEVSCDNANQPLSIDSNSEIFGGTWDSTAAFLRKLYGGFSGLWSESSDKYLGVRLKVDSNFYYGWVRLSVTVTGGYSVHASYTIRDYAYNSIPDSSILAGETGIPLGISNSLSEKNFSIFPNPSSNKITLSFSHSEKKEIQITNAIGQVVFAGEINSVKAEIDVMNFPAGIYLVSAQTPSQKTQTKFLKQ